MQVGLFLPSGLSLTIENIEKPRGVMGPQRAEFKYNHANEERLLDVNCFLLCKMGLTVCRPQVAPRMK